MLRRMLSTTVLTLLLAAPGPVVSAEPAGEPGSTRIPSPVSASPTAGIQPDRVPMLELRLSTAAAPESPDEEGSALARHVKLQLNPTRLMPAAPSGRRMGHGDVALSLPLGSVFSLRGGVRLDYDNVPADDTWVVESIPTIGFGLEF